MGELVVAGGDTSAVLDALEEVLDAVALLVEGLVVGVLSLAAATGRDDRVAALFDDFVVEAFGVIGLVGNDVFGGKPIDQIAGADHVVLLARTKDQADWQAEGVDADMELGPEAAARTAKRLGVLSPLFLGAPAAWA